MQNYKETSYFVDDSQLKVDDESYISQIQFKKNPNNILEDIQDK